MSSRTSWSTQTRVALSAWLLTVVASGTPAQADDTLDTLLQLSLEELANVEVITPTQTSTPLARAPGAVTLITREMIDRSAARTIPELLRLVPGVTVRWNPMVQTINIRSFGASPFTSRVLLLIDGVPYNSWNKGGFPQHPGFDFFNIELVDRLEVVRGAGSSLYGENAFNGMINIITLRGEEPAGRLRASLSSGDRDTQIVSASYDRGGEDRGVLLAARHVQSQLPLEYWLASDAQADGYDVYLKGRMQGLSASLYRREDQFDGFTEQLGSPTLPPGSVFRSADSIEQTINIAALAYEYAPDPDDWSVRSNVSFANRTGSHCAACHGRLQSPEFESSDEDHGSQAFANLRVESGVLGRHRVLFGAEWRRLRSGDHADELHGSQQTGMAHSDDSVMSYRKAALYVQDEVRALDDRLTIVAGLRYETATSPDLFGDQWFPRLSAVYGLNDRAVIRASFSQAARYPSFSELYQSSWFIAAESEFATIPLGVFTPNPGLEPEHITAIEVGGEVRFNERWQIKVDAFHNEVSDPISLAYGPFRNENHPQNLVSWGAETEVQGQPAPWLSGFLSWTYQRNTRRGNGIDLAGRELDLSYSPRHQVKLGVNVDPSPSWHVRLEASWRDEYTAPAFWYPIVFGDPEVRPLNAYALINAKAEYLLPFFQRSGDRPLSVSVLLRNITNQRPNETLTGVDGRLAGREIFVTLRYRQSQ